MANNIAHRIISSLMNSPKGISRKDIAKQLGVTRALITQQTAELIREGVAEEAGQVETGRVGRKEVLLRLTDHAGFVLGVDISLSNAQVSVLNMRADIIHFREITYEKLDSKAQALILEEVEKQHHAYRDRNLLGSAILVQGYVENGQCRTVQIDPLIRRIRELVGENCILQNNVRAMVTAQQYLENPPKDFVLLKYGPGVGGAIVTNGQLITGSKGAAGEIGHISWRLCEGRLCPVCGKKGCLESEVSYAAVLEKITGVKQKRASFSEMMAQSALDGHKALDAALDEMARAAAYMVQLLNPYVLYLAGELFINKRQFNRFVSLLRHHGCSREKLSVLPITNYRVKRKKAAGITMLDAYMRSGNQA